MNVGTSIPSTLIAIVVSSKVTGSVIDLTCVRVSRAKRLIPPPPPVKSSNFFTTAGAATAIANVASAR